MVHSKRPVPCQCFHPCEYLEHAGSCTFRIYSHDIPDLKSGIRESNKGINDNEQYITNKIYRQIVLSEDIINHYLCRDKEWICGQGSLSVVFWAISVLD